MGEAFAILHGQPMQPREAKAQELLFLLTAPKKSFEAALEERSEVEDGYYIL